MKNTSSGKTNPIAVILCLLALIFLGYGIYMVFDSIEYVNSYSDSSVTAESAMQYIVTSTMAYFGFSGIFFVGAYISQMLYSLKRSLNSSMTANLHDEHENIRQHQSPEQPKSSEQHKDTEKIENTEEITDTENTNEEEHHADMISSSMIKDIFEKK